MNAVERLKDALEKGGKVKGHRRPVYFADGTLKDHARQMIEIMAADVVEASDGKVLTDRVVADLRLGCQRAMQGKIVIEGIVDGRVITNRLPAEKVKVTVEADHLFHFVEQMEEAAVRSQPASVRSQE